MILTSDPDVVIEEQSPGYVKYKRLSNNKRWEVKGTCDQRGDCIIGSVVNGEVIRDKFHLQQIKDSLGIERIGSNLDIPVTPEFKTCCGSNILKIEYIDGN